VDEMEVKIHNFMKLKNGSYIFSISIDNMIYINGFRLVKRYDGDYFLALPQRKVGLKFEETVLLKKELRDEIYYNALIRLSEYKGKSKIEIMPF
jgi:DNA-binding cell septation regulator SpoVG